MNSTDTGLENPVQTRGIGRLTYFLSFLGLYAAVIAMALMPNDSNPLLINAIALPIIVGLFTLAALRFRNQGASGWWAVGFIVPILNIYASMRAFAYPPHYVIHRKFDTAAKVIIAIYVFLLLTVIASTAIPAYQHYMEATAAAR